MDLYAPASWLGTTSPQRLATRGIRFHTAAPGQTGAPAPAPAAAAAGEENSTGAPAGTGAPATPPAGAPAGASQPPAPAAPATATDSTGKPWTLDSAMAEIERVRREAGDARHDNKRRVNDALRTIASDLGLELPDGAPTVESLTAEIQPIRQENETLKTTNVDLARRNAADVAAWEAGIPADKRGYLQYLLSQDPEFARLDITAADFSAKVKAAIEAHKGSDPTLTAGGPGATRSGAEQFGGANGVSAVTQEQFDAYTYDQRLNLYKSNPEEYKRLADG